MKVLIIGHNAFSNTNNMGKTLKSYFSSFTPDEIVQFYIQDITPTLNICDSYYRITDKEAFLSVFGVPCGKEYKVTDIDINHIDSNKENKVSKAIYTKARQRTPLVYLMRNLWWKLSHWNNERLKAWIDNFDPDCIFFASGDYSFMYNIARTIAIYKKIPLYISCMDDYYLYNNNSNSIIGRLQYKRFMKSVCKAFEYSSKVFCICDKMSKDYSNKFHKQCITIYTPSTMNTFLEVKKKKRICYIGNLDLNRFVQLIEIGKALKELSLEPNRLDVYSLETRKEILDLMTEENGIVFHGGVNSEQVEKIIRDSMFVVHTEAFGKKERRRVKYSISTKIADYLMSGSCIFAYGPSDIASMEYLLSNNAAICCTNKDELKQSLYKLIIDEQERKKVIENAVLIANKNHAANVTPDLIRSQIETNGEK